VYTPGTVMVVGGAKEVTACQIGQRAIGVISTNPAVKMNSELEGGTYIALKGRVPVLVSGPVTKGDELTCGPNGTAIVGSTKVIAIALATDLSNETKLIESVIL